MSSVHHLLHCALLIMCYRVINLWSSFSLILQEYSLVRYSFSLIGNEKVLETSWTVKGWRYHFRVQEPCLFSFADSVYFISALVHWETQLMADGSGKQHVKLLVLLHFAFPLTDQILLHVPVSPTIGTESETQGDHKNWLHVHWRSVAELGIYLVI